MVMVLLTLLLLFVVDWHSIDVETGLSLLYIFCWYLWYWWWWWWCFCDWWWWRDDGGDGIVGAGAVHVAAFCCTGAVHHIFVAQHRTCSGLRSRRQPTRHHPHTRMPFWFAFVHTTAGSLCCAGWIISTVPGQLIGQPPATVLPCRWLIGSLFLVPAFAGAAATFYLQTPPRYTFVTGLACRATRIGAIRMQRVWCCCAPPPCR